MEVDILSPAQMKRGLLSCYQFLRWNSFDEVRQAFLAIQLCLTDLDWKEGRWIELTFMVGSFPASGEFQRMLSGLIARHGGRLVELRFCRGTKFVEVVAGIELRADRHQGVVTWAAVQPRVFDEVYAPVPLNYRPGGCGF